MARKSFRRDEEFAVFLFVFERWRHCRSIACGVPCIWVPQVSDRLNGWDESGTRLERQDTRFVRPAYLFQALGSPSRGVWPQ